VPRRRNKLLVAALAAAPLLAVGLGCLLPNPAVAQRKVRVEQPRPLVGTPQIVRDLHWGDVLF
jgi:hypothetical protein